MFASILSNTPTWVFAVFAALIAIGLMQTRPRTVSRRRLIVLPVVVAGYSLYGVAMASGGRCSARAICVQGCHTASRLRRARDAGCG